MWLCGILCLLVTVVHGQVKPTPTFFPTPTPPGYGSVCPRFTAIPDNFKNRGYPQREIKRALAFDKKTSAQLKLAKRDRRRPFAPARGRYADPPQAKLFPPCPYRLKRERQIKGCWVVWPAVRAARCRSRTCYGGPGGFRGRKGPSSPGGWKGPSSPGGWKGPSSPGGWKGPSSPGGRKGPSSPGGRKGPSSPGGRTCLPRHHVTYRRVLIGCKVYRRMVFRWIYNRITVPLSCGCWPCSRPPKFKAVG